MPSQTDQYGPNMQQIMMKILIISEVALLSEEIEDAAKYNVRCIRRAGPSAPGGSLLLSKMQSQLRFDTSPPNDESTNKPPNDSKGQVSNRGDASFAFHNSSTSPKGRKWANAFKKASTKKRDHRKSNLVDPATKAEVEKMLEWDEPQTKQKLSVRNVVLLSCFENEPWTFLHVLTLFILKWNDSSIRTILQFKETLNFMDTDHPLSVPFGLADSQKHCAESSQKVFERI